MISFFSLIQNEYNKALGQERLTRESCGIDEVMAKYDSETSISPAHYSMKSLASATGARDLALKEPKHLCLFPTSISTDDLLAFGHDNSQPKSHHTRWPERMGC